MKKEEHFSSVKLPLFKYDPRLTSGADAVSVFCKVSISKDNFLLYLLKYDHCIVPHKFSYECVWISLSFVGNISGSL